MPGLGFHPETMAQKNQKKIKIGQEGVDAERLKKFIAKLPDKWKAFFQTAIDALGFSGYDAEEADQIIIPILKDGKPIIDDEGTPVVRMYRLTNFMGWKLAQYKKLYRLWDRVRPQIERDGVYSIARIMEVMIGKAEINNFLELCFFPVDPGIVVDEDDDGKIIGRYNVVEVESVEQHRADMDEITTAHMAAALKRFFMSSVSAITDGILTYVATWLTRTIGKWSESAGSQPEGN